MCLQGLLWYFLKQPELPHLPARTSQAPCMATCPSKLLIMTAHGSWQGRHISPASRSRCPHIWVELSIFSVWELLWWRISSCALQDRIIFLFLRNCLGWGLRGTLWCMALGSQGDSPWCVWSAGVKHPASESKWKLGKLCLCRPRVSGL